MQQLIHATRPWIRPQFPRSFTTRSLICPDCFPLLRSLRRHRIQSPYRSRRCIRFRRARAALLWPRGGRQGVSWSSRKGGGKIGERTGEGWRRGELRVGFKRNCFWPGSFPWMSRKGVPLASRKRDFTEGPCVRARPPFSGLSRVHASLGEVPRAFE